MRSTFIIFCLLISALCFYSSCKFNPNIQGKGTASLQGVWEEDPYKYRDSLLQYTQYSLKFTCDSFYATLSTTAKVNYGDDSCYHNGSWKEYAKGNYVVRKDTLYIIGTFTKENFKQKISGCYRIGQYLPVFLIKDINPQKIILTDLQQQRPVTLLLKEKVSCTPKPL